MSTTRPLRRPQLSRVADQELCVCTSRQRVRNHSSARNRNPAPKVLRAVGNLTNANCPARRDLASSAGNFTRPDNRGLMNSQSSPSPTRCTGIRPPPATVSDKCSTAVDALGSMCWRGSRKSSRSPARKPKSRTARPHQDLRLEPCSRKHCPLRTEAWVSSKMHLEQRLMPPRLELRNQIAGCCC